MMARMDLYTAFAFAREMRGRPTPERAVVHADRTPRLAVRTPLRMARAPFRAAYTPPCAAGYPFLTDRMPLRADRRSLRAAAHAFESRTSVSTPTPSALLRGRVARLSIVGVPMRRAMSGSTRDVWTRLRARVILFAASLRAVATFLAAAVRALLIFCAMALRALAFFFAAALR